MNPILHRLLCQAFFTQHVFEVHPFLEVFPHIVEILNRPFHKDFMLLFSHSVTSDFLLPLWSAACQAPLSFTISQSFLTFMSTESVMLSNHPSFSCLLLLPSIFHSTRVFSESQLFASWGQSIGASASASVLPMNIQGWFPLGLPGLISAALISLSFTVSVVIQSSSRTAKLLGQGPFHSLQTIAI